MLILFRIIMIIAFSLSLFGCDRDVAVLQPEVSILSCTPGADGKVVIEVSGNDCDRIFGVVLLKTDMEPSHGWVRYNGTEAENGRIQVHGLMNDTGYVAYVVGIHDGEEVLFSKVVKEEFHVPSDESDNPDPMPEPEKIAFFADLDLLPGGSLAKDPKYWDEERFLPHVTFVDWDKKEKWLHEAFLLIDGSVDGKIMSIDNGPESADQAGWTKFINYWFGPGQALSILDQTIGKAVSRIGSPSFGEHKVVMTMPDPIMFQRFSDKNSSTRYWGSINGRELDFRNVSDQILAYRWFIDQVREAWDRLAPQNLRLAGFYILSEILVAKPGGFNYHQKRWDQILPSVSDYLHSMNYGLYWIPYYKADGYDMTAKLGIDYTWIQPNAYWDYPEKEHKKEWGWVFSTMNTYGHGMELEFEGSHGEGGWSQAEDGVKRTSSSILATVRTNDEAEGRKPGEKNPYAERNRNLLRDYMENFKKNGFYGKARIATYSGTNAMYELATSPDEVDRHMYLEYCRFIVENPLRK